MTTLLSKVFKHIKIYEKWQWRDKSNVIIMWKKNIFLNNQARNKYTK